MTVEGFDVATGRTTWSVRLGAAEAFMEDGYEATAVSDNEVLVRGGNAPVMVDLSKGSTRAPASGEVFWCSENGFFTYRESKHFRNRTSSNAWRGGTLLRPCLPDGSSATEAPRQIARSLGATVGDRTVVAIEGALVAYDRGPRPG